MELTNVINLCNDRLTDSIGLYSEKAAKYGDEAIRAAFAEIFGTKEVSWRNFRNHKNEFYTIIEEIVTTNLPSAWDGSPFYKNCVEVKNRLLGDTNEFVVEDASVLVASSFAGNHWDTDRKKLHSRRAFAVPMSWIYVRFYDDFERFMKRIVSFPEFMKKIQKAMANEIDARIFASFNAASTYLPSKFQVTGSYDRSLMSELIQRVQVATGRNVYVLGTRTALANIMDGIDSKFISESQKEEIATKGCLYTLTGLGVVAIEVPQTFIRGTYDFKVNNNKLLVMPEGEMFIKLFYEGDTRALELDESRTHDQTIDVQLQTKVGTACVFGDLHGSYNIE